MPSPTKKQLTALKDMMLNLEDRFTEEEIDSVISDIKTAKEASEALGEIRAIRVYENYSWFMKKQFEDPTKKPTVYYQKLWDVSEPRRLRRSIEKLEESAEYYKGKNGSMLGDMHSYYKEEAEKARQRLKAIS